MNRIEQPNSCVTPPDERGNVFHIEGPELGLRIVREAVAWYCSQQHHIERSQPESNRRIWIYVKDLLGGAHRVWKYLPSAQSEASHR